MILLIIIYIYIGTRIYKQIEETNNIVRMNAAAYSIREFNKICDDEKIRKEYADFVYKELRL